MSVRRSRCALIEAHRVTCGGGINNRSGTTLAAVAAELVGRIRGAGVGGERARQIVNSSFTTGLETVQRRCTLVLSSTS